MSTKRSIGFVLFDGFEVLDVFGPLEMFWMCNEHFDISLVSESGGVVTSSQGPKSVCDHSFEDQRHFDILLVPGGRGTRREVENKPMLEWLATRAGSAEFVTSVCTGSALLAKVGILDGIRATTNKAAFEWVRSQGPSVRWQEQARWVEDDMFFTSSGVSAGCDMALGLIAKLHGRAAAEEAACWAEYEWHDDPDWDPFAKVHGLIE